MLFSCGVGMLNVTCFRLRYKVAKFPEKGRRIVHLRILKGRSILPETLPFSILQSGKTYNLT